MWVPLYQSQINILNLNEQDQFLYHYITIIAYTVYGDTVVHGLKDLKV